MSVDRIPDDPDDPVSPAGTARLRDSPQPDPVRSTPEPEHPSPPDRRQPPDQEPKPEGQPQGEKEPRPEEPPESSTPTNESDAPAPTDSPSRPNRNTPDSTDTAEPRSRQEHAAPTDIAEEAGQNRQDEPSQENDKADLEYQARSNDSLDEYPPSDEVPPESAESGKDADRPPGAGPADETFRPLTDQEYVEHVTEVCDGLAKAHNEGLSTEFLHTIDPDHLRWTRERRQIHAEITEAIYARAANVPCDHKAIIAGGLGGAGKTTILHTEAGVDLSQYLMINPDNVKEEMAKRELAPQVEGLSPMEATDLVHEESSAIAKQLARRAYAEGKNLIWDITMSSVDSTATRVADLRRAGYTKVEGIFVDIPVEVSIERTQARHREGHEEFRAGRGLGGRYVPPEVIRAQADAEWGSQNRKTFEAVKHEFDNWTRYDNSVYGRKPLTVDRSANKDMRQLQEEDQ